MAALGVILILLGSLSMWVADDKMDVGDWVLNMDQVGAICLIVGVGALIYGIALMAIASNTSHRERHDVIVDRTPDEEPVVVKRRRPRKDIH